MNSFLAAAARGCGGRLLNFLEPFEVDLLEDDGAFRAFNAGESLFLLVATAFCSSCFPAISGRRTGLREWCKCLFNFIQDHI